MNVSFAIAMIFMNRYIKSSFKSTDLTVESQIVFLANKAVINMVDKHCSHLPSATMKTLVLTMLKFIVPTRDGVPWVIKTNADIAKMKNLFMKLPPSAAVSKSLALVRKPPSSSSLEKNTSVASGRKAKAKPKSKGADPAAADDAPLAAVLAEDIVGAVTYYASRIRRNPCVDDKRGDQVIDKLVSVCVEFALEGEVRCLSIPDLKKLKLQNAANLAYLADPAEAQMQAIHLLIRSLNHWTTSLDHIIESLDHIDMLTFCHCTH